ncbi:hypothetical protein BG000_008223 [Podila horticola]|nr:hypothetical protein BG000_008223 [Podila horticola]
MPPKTENTVTQYFETIIKVDTQVPDEITNPVAAEQMIDPDQDFKWMCTFTNEGPLLKITLWWSCPVKNLKNIFPPQGMRCMIFRSLYGKHLGGISVNGLQNEVPNSTQVDLCEVQVGDRLLFDIVLSPSEDPLKPPATLDRLFPSSHGLLSSLLKDLSSMNIAFTFGVSGAARNVGLWAHQSVLAQEPKLAALINKLKIIERDQSDGIAGIKSLHVTEHSLEAYCCLLRFLYLDQIDLDVNLEDFAIGYPPSKSNLPSCRDRPTIEGLGSVTGHPTPKRGTSWKELFEPADCYQVMRLREYCRIEIVSSLDKSNAVDILFEFAYRHHDLKDHVLEYLSNSVDNFYSGDRDPFTAYKDHSEGYSLVVEILKRINIRGH